LECRRENTLHAPVLFDHAFDIGAAQTADQRGIDLPGIPKGDMLKGERSLLGHAIHRIPVRTWKPQDSAYNITGFQIVGNVAEFLELCGGAVEIHIEGFSGTMREISGSWFLIELCHWGSFGRAVAALLFCQEVEGRELRVYEAAGVSMESAPGADGAVGKTDVNLRSIAVRRYGSTSCCLSIH